MGDTDDLPFACNEQGCTMKFTNEDHLMVHLQRHQMSLTFGAGGGNKFLFQDQTPTPTKFLRNCEEIGLFNDIKNPFDDAFSKAVTDGKDKFSSTPSIESPMIFGVHHESDTLNTPTPHMLNTPTPHMQNDTPIKKRYRRYESLEPAPEFVPGPVSDLDSTAKNTKSTVLSTSHTANIQTRVVKTTVPVEKLGQRQPNDRVLISSTLTDNPASQEGASLEFEVVQSSLDHDVSSQSYPHEQMMSPPGSVHRLSRDSPLSRDSFMSPPGSVQSISRDSLMSPPGSVHSIRDAVLSPGHPDDMKSEYIMTARPETVTILEQASSMDTDIVRGNTPLNLSSAGSTPTEPKLDMKHIVARPTLLTGLNTVTQGNNGPVSNSSYLLQVMIQTPEGKLMPVHIPAAIPSTVTDTLATGSVPMATNFSNITTSTGNVGAVSMNLSASTTHLSNLATHSFAPITNTVVKGEIQPAFVGSSVAVTSTTGSANASSFAKQKIKERLLQSQTGNSPTGGNMPVLTEAVERVTSERNHPRLSRDSWLSSHDSSQGSFEVEYQDADSTYKYISNSTTATTPDDSEPDEKRRKFLERNRAAAMRCRTKKKHWVTNLERKAEDLQYTNSKLQNEVTQLKAEMVQLKTLLLAHKDCPITLQQRQSGQLQLYSDSMEKTSMSKPTENLGKSSTKLVPIVSACNAVTVATLRTNNNGLSTNSDHWSTGQNVQIIPITSQNVLTTNNATLAIDLSTLNQS